MPGYEYFDFKQYARDTSKWKVNPKNLHISSIQMPILTSRSCPNQCYFCAMRLVMGDKFRLRTPKHVVDEIEYLYKEYDINYFRIMDDNFTLNKRRTMDICDLIHRRKLNIYFDLTSGVMVRTLDKEVIDALCETGMLRVPLAIESGNDYIRNNIVHKNLSKDKIYEIINLLKQHKGIILEAFFIVGYPEETEETIKDTIEMIENVDVSYIMASRINPFPGTVLYKQCIRDNLFVDDFKTDLDKAWMGELNNTKATNPGLHKFVIKPYNMSMEKLENYYNIIQDILETKNRFAIHQLHE